MRQKIKHAVGVCAISFFTVAYCAGQYKTKQAVTASPTAYINVSMGNLHALSPNIYGQFIEFLGNCINGGIYDKGSALSDEDGFRKDVLEKVKQLAPPLLRYPGGTFTKIYHWEDGIGPVNARPKRKNLIWGGIEDNAFGTAEFVTYCRKIGAEPFLVVNMATGTPEEAAHWVEYCNGTEDTYYANLRRAHGYQQPFNVKYWGLGNEEEAVPDPGKLQDAYDYSTNAWQYIKLMKLTDTSLRLVVAGGSKKWDDVVVKQLGGAVNYLSVHLYAAGAPGKPAALFENIQSFEDGLVALQPMLKLAGDTVANWSKWYRFPARRGPIMLAVDEWGIWKDANASSSNFGAAYNWQDALATASFLNIFQRNSSFVGLATWAQMVNTLAPLTTTAQGSFYQTVFYPLCYYRKYAGGQSVQVNTRSPLLPNTTTAQCLDVSATYAAATKTLTLFVVNRAAKNVTTRIKLPGMPVGQVTTVCLQAGEGVGSANNVNVGQQESEFTGSMVFKASSVTICVYQL